MTVEKESASFICVKDALGGAYPLLVLGINAARQGMESKLFDWLFSNRVLCTRLQPQRLMR